MHVLITRPEAEGQALKAEVERLGVRATLAPLISVLPNTIPASAVANAEALIATSRNALKALAASPAAFEAARSLPLYVVGPGTAALARTLGFTDIIEGPGTALGLMPLLSARGRGAGRPLVHLTGDVLAFDLKAALAAEEINIVSIPAYASVAATELPPTVAAGLATRDIDAVILMSPRTARTWASLVAALVPAPDLSDLIHICLSETVEEGLAALGNAKMTLVARKPNQEEVLALLKCLAADFGTR